MAFDPTRYRETYLVPKGRLKLSALPDDLLDRYAISLPASDADVAATVKAVRAVWASQQPGSRTATLAKLCIGADDVLKAANGERMLTAAWWEQQATLQQKATGHAVDQLAELLTETHGAFGCITQVYLDGCARTLGLEASSATKAVEQAGLIVLSTSALPERSPVPDSQYSSLETQLATAGVPTVVHLLHPDVADFGILVQFTMPARAGARLDGDAVGTQLIAAEKVQVSAAADARREALRMLRTIAKATDLHQLALHNIAEFARRHQSLGPAGVRKQLLRIGVNVADAAALAVLTSDAIAADAVVGPQRVEFFLAEGRLREATQAAHELPSGYAEQKAALLARVATTRARYDQLIAEAMELLRAHDEVTALSRVLEAGALSAEDAELVLATIPLAPPLALAVGIQGAAANLHWQPNVGHSDETVYIVRRDDSATPRNVVDGAAIYSGQAHEAVDADSPVARTLHYSVFATAPRRTASRPATVSVAITPAVGDLHADIGADQVTFRWSGHPQVYRYAVKRRLEDGAPRTDAVEGTSVRIGGLTEGQPVSIEVVAEYRAPDAATLRSEPRNITAIPRARAHPVEMLRARPIAGDGANVAISWTKIDRSDVRIRRSDSPCPWPPGSWVTPEEFTQFGEEVSGRTSESGMQATLHALLPEGRAHYLVALSIGGTGIVVGAETIVGITEPVRRLDIREFAGFAKVTWLWPAGSTLAEVTWERDGSDTDAVGVERIKLSEYERNGGIDIPIGEADTAVEVRALLVVEGRTFTSAPVRHVISSARMPRLHYSVESSPRLGPVGGRSKRFVFRAESAVVSTRVQIVASAGMVMPTSVETSIVLADITLSLGPGATHVEAVSVPRSIGRPYWVRCLRTDDRIELVDPPIHTLKEA